MSAWELTLPPERPQRDPTTGRFLPGSTPFNKGMKWADYMDESDDLWTTKIKQQ